MSPKYPDTELADALACIALNAQDVRDDLREVNLTYGQSIDIDGKLRAIINFVDHMNENLDLQNR